MKRKVNKNLAAAAAVILVAANLAACSKISPDRLESIAKDMKADVIDIDDLDDCDADDVKDGIFFRADGDEFEDYMDDLKEKTGGSGMTSAVLNGFDLNDVIKIKKVDEVAAYISGEVSEDNKEGISENVMIFKMQDKDAASDAFDKIVDKLKDNTDIDIDKLSKDEFEEGKKFVLNADTDDVTDIYGDIIDNVMSSKLGPLASIGDIKDSAKEMKKELRQQLGDDFRMVIAIYVKNDMITFVQGTTISDDFEKLPEITLRLGISDPLKVKNSDELIDGLGSYEIDFDLSSLGDLRGKG